ncbi:Nrap protein [Zopfochytrium polystomum]|nr:Nrap protein [Zopfochytrium polystomum]
MGNIKRRKAGSGVAVAVHHAESDDATYHTADENRDASAEDAMDYAAEGSGRDDDGDDRGDDRGDDPADEDAEDENGEDDDDEDEDDREDEDEENGHDGHGDAGDGGDLGLGTGEPSKWSKPEKSSGAPAFKAPTIQELHELRETTDLYQSNLFKLQIEELVKEVALSNTKTSPLDKVLHSLKEVMDKAETIPECSLAEAIAKMKAQGISIPFPHPPPADDVKYKFSFKTPSKVFIAGSYLLKTVAKNPRLANIDVAVQMPDEMFQDKDHVNYRYFHKRAFYLAVLASVIRRNAKVVPVSLSFDTMIAGDRRRPVLVLSPVPNGSAYDFSKLKCSIRIIPCISASLFKPSKLAPGRNNVRPSQTNNASEAGLAATPRYNANILHDTSYASHLNFLHQQFAICPAFREAVLLGKVWLAQRGLYQPFGGFLLTMIMGYLFRTKAVGKTGIKLGSSYSSYQIIKLTIEFISKHDFKGEPIFMTPDGKPLEEPEFSLDAFARAYDAVIVDPTGRVNLAAFVSVNTLEKLRYEARSSLTYFNDLGADRFDSLFLKNLSHPLVNFDNVICLHKPPGVFPAYKPSVALDFPSRNDFIRYFIPKLLLKGLKNRVRLISVEQDAREQWQINESPPTADAEFRPLVIGIILDPENGTRAVEMGPNPEDAEAIADFRRMWGNKSEMRRFKDGTIAESVVWDSAGTLDARTQVTSQMAVYLMSRHGSVDPDTVTCWGGQLLPFLQEFGGNKSLRAVEVRRGTFQNAYEAFQELAKEIRASTGLPLTVTNVIPSHAGLSYSSTFIPQPHHTAGGPAIDYNAPVHRDFMGVLVEFESSGRWPEQLIALQNMKLAFFVALSKSLQLQLTGAQISISKPLDHDPIYSGYMDVSIPPGYSFRLRLRTGREIPVAKDQLVRARMAKAGSSTVEAPSASLTTAQRYADQAECLYRKLPRHSTRIHNLCLKFPPLSTTCRLLKRFVGAHLLSNIAITDEACDLLAARVFTDCAPYAAIPTTSWCGFIRCLAMLRDWAWDSEILFVEHEGAEITQDARAAAVKEFEKVVLSPQKGRVFEPRIATSDDVEGLWWLVRGVSDKVKSLAFKRLCAAATASLKFLEDQVVSGSDLHIAKLFATPTDGFDILIRLDPLKLSKFHQNISYDRSILPTPKTDFKNLKFALDQDETIPLLERFDALERFVIDLQVRFGNTVSLFFDQHGGDTVALLWDKTVSQEINNAEGKPWKAVRPYAASVASEGSEEVERGSGRKRKRDGKNEAKTVSRPDVLAMIGEMERIGEGLVVGVEVRRIPPAV